MSRRVVKRWFQVLCCVLTCSGWLLGSGAVHPARAIVIDTDTWDVIYVGLAGLNGSTSDTVVSRDGVYCQYPPDFPIKAPAEVRLWLDGVEEPYIATLNTLMAEIYPAETRLPGEPCAIWAQFRNVPMAQGYRIVIGDEPPGRPVASSTGELAVIVEFWTARFVSVAASGDFPECAPVTENGVMPGVLYRTAPATTRPVTTGIVGTVWDSSCNMSLSNRVAPTGGIAIAIGEMPLSGDDAADRAGGQWVGDRWRTVDIGVEAGTVVSADGTRCIARSGEYPVSPGSIVTLVTASGHEFRKPLSDDIALFYPAGTKAPGDLCSLWAQFLDVPAGDGYAVQLDPPDGQATQVISGLGGLIVEFWTYEFISGVADDGRPTCEPAVEAGPLPTPGDRIGNECRVAVINRLPNRLPAHLVIGDMSGQGGSSRPTASQVTSVHDSTPGEVPPLKGPAWLEGAVERRFIVSPGDPSGVEALSFMVVAFDPAAMPNLASTDMTDILAPALDQVEDPFVRSLSEKYPGTISIVPVPTIGDFSTVFFADAPGDGLDFGLLFFWHGPNFQVVMIGGRGDTVLQQLVDISNEWAITGGAGENGWRAVDPNANAPRTDGLWAYLPLPGQLESLPVSFRFDGDRLVAVGERP